MPLLCNITKLQHENVRLRGTLTAEELEIDKFDELIQFLEPMEYELEVQRVEDGVLVEGSLRVPLHCECVRCLKPFASELYLADWACLLALEGEEKVTVVNDCVDLTPIIREDSLLAMPRHPLCRADCGGLPGRSPSSAKPSGSSTSEGVPSAWDVLDKLKL